ncbi:hypothetical protein ACQUFD_17715, partial [Enterococcus gallinarum]|uniref:hypothetical protein n=1 Tax=Enterococcus gallinarum TaxID=1353 RepID=UPI003D0B43D7
FREKPELWSQYSVRVPDRNMAWTADALYHHTVDKLSEWNKKDLIYGFIPGYRIIDFLVHVTGAQPGFSYWFACFLLALVV